ncbi:MAG TPA: LOG family protein [Anaerolineae bacterium]
MPHPKGLIASVFGSNSPREGESSYAQARRLGCLLAHAGYVVATGGYFGTMEATSRGAKEGGGHVIGVTTSVFDGIRMGTNPYVDEEIKFPSLFQRLHHLVAFADVWVALPGGIGTLSEVALTWSLMQVGEVPRQPFVVVGTLWRDLLKNLSSSGYVALHYHDLIAYAETVEDVVPLLRRET